MFHLKLLINFFSLSIVGQIDWNASGGIHRISQPCVEAKRISGLILSRSFWLAMCRHIFMLTHVLARLVGPTIVMAAYNNNDILIVPYEDLPNRDKDVISKAIEEFQNKCLFSYTKTRDNTIVQKYPLPRVLLHG